MFMVDGVIVPMVHIGVLVSMVGGVVSVSMVAVGVMVYMLPLGSLCLGVVVSMAADVMVLW
jgi:hypothetical protein